jgi:hypothetical protein
MASGHDANPGGFAPWTPTEGNAAAPRPSNPQDGRLGPASGPLSLWSRSRSRARLPLVGCDRSGRDVSPGTPFGRPCPRRRFIRGVLLTPSRRLGCRCTARFSRSYQRYDLLAEIRELHGAVRSVAPRVERHSYRLEDDQMDVSELLGGRVSGWSDARGDLDQDAAPVGVAVGERIASERALPEAPLLGGGHAADGFGRAGLQDVVEIADVPAVVVRLLPAARAERRRVVEGHATTESRANMAPQWRQFQAGEPSANCALRASSARQRGQVTPRKPASM